MAREIGFVILAAVASAFNAATYVSGDVPAAPMRAVSGGEVFLELAIDAAGSVASIRTLRTSPPFTETTIQSVQGWRFVPATMTDPADGVPKAVAAHVLVAAIFAPPALSGPTLGKPPGDVATASGDAPFPTRVVPAAYPPRALGTGTVLVEVTVEADGSVTGANIKASSPAFDAAALAAARAWGFRPARVGYVPTPVRAYLLFAFPEPVLGRR